MVNVSLELKDPKGKESPGSLARYGFNGTILLLVTGITVTVLPTVHIFCFSIEQRLQIGGLWLEVVYTVLFGWLTQCFLKVYIRCFISKDRLLGCFSDLCTWCRN